MGPHVTGIQAWTASFAASLAALREQLSPRERAVALDVLARMVGAELEQNESAQRRWAR
jgi:hypothetical protein